MRMRILLLPVALALLLASFSAAAAPPTSDDGTAVPSCAAKLVPCGPYLNSTSAPPAACCGPLKDAAFNQTACMCGMLLNKAALQAFGVAPEKGMALAKRCGVTVDASVCAKYTDAGTGVAGADTAGSSASTGGSASTVSKPTANGPATRPLSLLGASSFAGFSFIWWSIMA